LFEITNHPVCAAEEWDLFIEAQPPLEKEGNELVAIICDSSNFQKHFPNENVGQNGWGHLTFDMSG
jgi:hypothetical protein